MATARKPDQESLMALEALLKIRTENGGRTAARRSSSVTPTNAVGAAAPMPTSIGSGIAPVAGSVPGENQMPSSIQSTSGRSATLGLPPAAPNGNAATNMHTLVPAPYALQAMPPLQSMSTHSFETAAAAAAAAARGIFGTAATATHYNQTAANNSPPAPHPVQPITTGHLVQQHDSTAPLGGSQQPQPKKRRKSTSGRSSAAQSLVYKENNGVDKINSDQSNDDGTTTSKADIRQDQIEAALKSKPQRGRKRENLSVLERAELTRTRNREHAKSTRIRKKLRYQELVDKEVQFELLKKNNTLLDQQRANMAAMVDRLQSMLNDSSASHQYATLDPLLEDPDAFAFKVNGVQHFSIPAGIDSWKTEVFETVSTALQTDHDMLPVELRIVGGIDGVAVSPGGKCFADVHCIVNHNGQELPFLEASLSFTFGQDTDKIRCGQWSSVTKHTPAPVQPRGQAANAGLVRVSSPSMPAESSSGSSGSSRDLRIGTSYPSVVSLDPTHPSPAAASSAEQEGPGMAI